MNSQAQITRQCPSQHLLRNPLPLLWAIPLLLVVTAPSCGDDDLKRVGRTLNEAARSIQILQTTVIDARDADLINKNSADAVVTITVKVARAIGRANTLTRNFSRLDPEDRNGVLEILEPVLIALQAGAADEALTGITDDSLKASIKLAFAATITALQAAKAIMEVS